MTNLDVVAAVPLLMMVLGSLFFLLLSLFRDETTGFPRLWWGVGVCLGSWILSIPQAGKMGLAFNGMVFVDTFVFVFYSIILAGLAITFLLGEGHLRGQRMSEAEDIDILLLMAGIGAMVMVSAANLIVLFVGFELLSVAVYVLTGLARKERASAEGSLKYFILGAFSSAFLLYGMTLAYGATGTMEIAEIGRAAATSSSPLLLVALGLMVFGFGFKVSLVPFHFWTPDVYQGAPSSIAGFMAVVVKAAAFGAFLRIMHTGFGLISGSWVPLIWILSVVTMTFGNIVALRQRSTKRMLAYSSIAHAGYALMGSLVLGPDGGGAAMVFYLIVYSVMTLGAFGVVVVATAGSPSQYDADDVRALEGLGWSHPLLGIAMVVAMLSLAGVPPLAGFVGKFYLFSAAVRGGFTGLAVIAAINSVISLYYYLRVIVVMYFTGDRSLEWSPPRKLVLSSRVALGLATVGTIYFGLFSTRYFAMAQEAILALG